MKIIPACILGAHTHTHNGGFEAPCTWHFFCSPDCSPDCSEVITVVHLLHGWRHLLHKFVGQRPVDIVKSALIGQTYSCHRFFPPCRGWIWIPTIEIVVLLAVANVLIQSKTKWQGTSPTNIMAMRCLACKEINQRIAVCTKINPCWAPKTAEDEAKRCNWPGSALFKRSRYMWEWDSRRNLSGSNEHDE